MRFFIRSNRLDEPPVFPFVAKLSLCIALALVAGATASEPPSEATTTVRVPLRDGRYRVADMRLALGRATTVSAAKGDPATEAEERILSQEDRGALVAGEFSELWVATLTDDYLELRFPSRRTDKGKEIATKLKKMFAVDKPAAANRYGLRLPENFEPKARTFLLVHGLESSGKGIGELHRSLESRGIQVVDFEYPNDGPIAESGQRLSADLKQLTNHFQGVRVAIIGHSMGGLVARHAIEVGDRNLDCVTDLFLLGTPNAGSSLAVMQPIMELLNGVPNPFRIKEVMSDGWGEAGDDLKPNSEFLQRLQKSGLNDKTRYFTIVGRRSFVTKERQRKIIGEVEGIFDRRGTKADERIEVVALLNAPELTDGLGDGAVSIKSAGLLGAQDHREFDLNHAELAMPKSKLPEGDRMIDWILDRLGWK